MNEPRIAQILFQEFGLEAFRVNCLNHADAETRTELMRLIVEDSRGHFDEARTRESENVHIGKYMAGKMVGNIFEITDIQLQIDIVQRNSRGLRYRFVRLEQD